MPGRPDLVLPKYRAVIFVHGCFWHRHHGCNLAYTPKSNVAFWTRKFESNVRRDRRVRQLLRREGWQVVTLWECQIVRDLASAVDRVLSSISRHE